MVDVSCKIMDGFWLHVDGFDIFNLGFRDELEDVF